MKHQKKGSTCTDSGEIMKAKNATVRGGRGKGRTEEKQKSTTLKVGGHLYIEENEMSCNYGEASRAGRIGRGRANSFRRAEPPIDNHDTPKLIICQGQVRSGSQHIAAETQPARFHCIISEGGEESEAGRKEGKREGGRKREKGTREKEGPHTASGPEQSDFVWLGSLALECGLTTTPVTV